MSDEDALLETVTTAFSPVEDFLGGLRGRINEIREELGTIEEGIGQLESRIRTLRLIRAAAATPQAGLEPDEPAGEPPEPAVPHIVAPAIDNPAAFSKRWGLRK